MRFADNWNNRPVYIGRAMDSTRITESSGYRTAEQQVRDLVNGGVRLEAYRRAVYDYDQDPGDDFAVDPTRSLQMDFADADALYKYYKNILTRVKEAKKPQETVMSPKVKEAVEKALKEDTDAETANLEAD